MLTNQTHIVIPARFLKPDRLLGRPRFAVTTLPFKKPDTSAQNIQG
jgi:hypothetical protein